MVLHPTEYIQKQFILLPEEVRNSGFVEPGREDDPIQVAQNALDRGYSLIKRDFREQSIVVAGVVLVLATTLCTRWGAPVACELATDLSVTLAVAILAKVVGPALIKSRYWKRFGKQQRLVNALRKRAGQN